jgi:hypothetical protein
MMKRGRSTGGSRVFDTSRQRYRDRLRRLAQLETPPATTTHVPIPPFCVVDLIKTTLGIYGHQVTAENYGCTKDRLRFFGVLSLRSAYTGYEDVLVLRRFMGMERAACQADNANREHKAHKNSPSHCCHLGVGSGRIGVTSP